MPGHDGQPGARGRGSRYDVAAAVEWCRANVWSRPRSASDHETHRETPKEAEQRLKIETDRQLAELNLAERRGELCSVATMQGFLESLAELWRTFGEDLRRMFGEEASALYERMLDAAERQTDEFFSDR